MKKSIDKAKDGKMRQIKGYYCVKNVKKGWKMARSC